jgi:hypothetical protein
LYSLLCALPLLASCGGESSLSYSKKEGSDAGDYSLNYYEDKKGFFIEDYLGSDSSISIPLEATVGEVTAPIVGISEFAFAGRSVREIHLSQNIHSIGGYAFHQSSLQRLVVTPYLLEVDPNAFANCSISFAEKDGVKYLPTEKGDRGYAIAFSGGEKATVTLAEECEAIYDDIFTGAQTINVGMNVKSFGNIAPWCRNILPSTLEEISVIKVGNNALRLNKTLKSVTISGYSSFIGQKAISDTNVESIRIEDGVESIRALAFSGCESLTSILIPESVTSIGREAFGGCKALTTISLPSSLKAISQATFTYCESLTSITLPEGITSIGIHAFSHCSSIKTISIPKSVTSIDGWAFLYIPFESVFVPINVTSMGKNVFYPGGNLTITIQCEAESKPSGWNAEWCGSQCTVVWGYKQ